MLDANIADRDELVGGESLVDGEQILDVSVEFAFAGKAVIVDRGVELDSARRLIEDLRWLVVDELKPRRQSLQDLFDCLGDVAAERIEFELEVRSEFLRVGHDFQPEIGRLLDCSEKELSDGCRANEMDMVPT